MKLKEQILELRKKGKTINEIVNALGCAKSTVSYHINNYGLGYTKKITDEIIKEINEYYTTHSIIETSRKFKISYSTISRYCKNKRILSTKLTKKERGIEAVQKRRRKLKSMAVDYKGGKCVKCEYNRCNDALEFHHLNPNEKDFAISASGNTRSWDKIKKELDKCILVCANCHREIHHELKK